MAEPEPTPFLAPPLQCATCAAGTPSADPGSVAVVDGKPICAAHLAARQAILDVVGAFGPGAH